MCDSYIDNSNTLFDLHDVVVLHDNDNMNITCSDTIEAGSVGFLSESNYVYLNTLMIGQSFCGCNNDDNDSCNSSSDIPSSRPSIDNIQQV
jgi:hypothetical protein